MNQTQTSRIPTPGDAQPRRNLRLLALALAGGLVTVFLLRQEWAKEQIWPWALLAAVMLAGGPALRRLELWLPGESVLPRLAAFPRANRRWVGLVCLLSALLLTGTLIWRLWPDYRQWQGTPLLWLATMVLAILGAWLLGAVGRGSPRAATGLRFWPDTKRNRWLEALAFGLILGLAIFLRTYKINEIPAGIYVDETNSGLEALYILEGRSVSPFGTGWYGTPNGYIYFMAGMFRLFGANWISLKLVSLIPAILTIPAVFLLGRLLFGPLVGLSAMLLMAVSRWHLSMSRWGWNETAPPLFQVLAFYFLIRGLRDRRALDYALSGLLTGLMTYTYLSSRLALVTLVLYILFWFLTDPSGWRAAMRRSWTGLLILLVSAVVAVSPILVTYITDPFTYKNRVNEISVLKDIHDQQSLKPLTDNLVDILKFFHQTGDLQGKHNLPGEPMTDPVTGLLFAIGLAYAVIGWKDQRRWLLLIWLILGLAGSFLSSNHESPQSYRSLTALPAVVILAADVLDRAGRALLRWLGERSFAGQQSRLPAIAAGGMIILALTGATVWESTVYFGRQAQSIAVLRGFNPMENQIAKEVIAAWRADKAIYLSPKFSEFSPLRFFLYGVVKETTGQNTLDDRPYKVILPEVNLPVPDSGQEVLLLLDSEYWPLSNYFTSIYPEAQIDLVRLPDDSPLYMRVEISHQQVAAIQGLIQRQTAADGTVEECIVAQVEAPADEQADPVEWDGVLRLEHGIQLDLITEGGLQVSVDGKPWSGSTYLGRGIYSLHILRPAGSTGQACLFWKLGDQGAVTIPPEALFHIPLPRTGLLSSYYPNQNWEGNPVFQQVTPFLLLAWPDETPLVSVNQFSARYQGILQITKAGNYLLRVEADDGARLTLDGVVIGEGMTAGQPNSFETTRLLTPGKHQIQLDYFQQGGGSTLRLLWKSDDQPLAPIPPAALIPAQP
jgi:hypothetical protein